MREPIGRFLLRRLCEAGVGHLFGVPGDYNLGLMQMLEEAREPVWVGTCNELGASYAADGYARVAGFGALVVTHGVGALSAINGIAGAFCEHVPVLCVSGAPPLRARDRGLFMHHGLDDGGTRDFMRAFDEVTVASARLTPSNAAVEIDRLIRAAWTEKRPAYLELPSDIVYLEIDVPSGALRLAMPPSDRERLAACATLIGERLARATKPALLVGTDAQRFGVLDDVVALADALRMPVALMSGAKGAFPEHSERFAGTYLGAASAPATRAIVEESDCLITIGYRFADSTTGFFSSAIPPDAIRIHAGSVDAGGDNFQAVFMAELLARLRGDVMSIAPAHATPAPAPVPTSTPLAAAAPSPLAAPAPSPMTVRETVADQTPLTQATLWAIVADALRPGDAIVAEIGTAGAGCAALPLPPGSTIIAQPIWGSIGYSLGALLGSAIAAPQRRHLLFIGDGAFQMTAQELSTILRHDLRPIVVLLNNRGYTIERVIFGADAGYNDVANWRYADLPAVFAPASAARSFRVATAGELRAALAAERDALLFIEADLDANDAQPGLVRMGRANAELDFGPRGPHRTADPHGLPGTADAARPA